MLFLILNKKKLIFIKNYMIKLIKKLKVKKFDLNYLHKMYLKTNQ